LGSWLDARHAGGRWLVRMEDIDTPRVRRNADSLILRTLETLGLHWDGDVQYQSSRLPAYADALHRLRAAGLLYPCACKRREVSGRPYPGTCRDKRLDDGKGRSLRLRVTAGDVRFMDAIQGLTRSNVAEDSGDIIVRRADGLTAYHLGVVIDDHWQAVTRVVRGADLLEATAAQLQVQKSLGLPAPEYSHLPMAVDAQGRKISKSLGAEAALLKSQPGALLLSVLGFLGQEPDAALKDSSVQDILAWATHHWRVDAVPRVRKMQPGLIRPR
jgi:glutamyl-Q tRNA(Asp) synthetase